MKESLEKTVSQYLAAFETIRAAFKWESNLMYPVCANLYVQSGTDPEPERIKDCKRLVKQSVGIFSSFRGNLMLPLACMLANSESPEAVWDRALSSYTALKQHFWGSEYLALAAVAMTEPEGIDIERVAERGRTLYERMKKEHPFLTGQEDSVFAVLLAQSEKSDDGLLSDMERCYNALSDVFPKSNAMQSASHILTLGEGDPKEKAERVIRLYGKIRSSGAKYGKNYELPVLAAASLLDTDEDELVKDILDAEERLRESKRYRGLFGFTSKQRSMHAAMLVTTYGAKEAQKGLKTAQMAASQSALSIVIAQEIMMCVCISASASASAAASSAH